MTKIVYEDDGHSKVINGSIISEDEFIIKIRCEPRGNILEIGRRGIIKIDRRGY